MGHLSTALDQRQRCGDCHVLPDCSGASAGHGAQEEQGGGGGGGPWVEGEQEAGESPGGSGRVTVIGLWNFLLRGSTVVTGEAAPPWRRQVWTLCLLPDLRQEVGGEALRHRTDGDTHGDWLGEGSGGEVALDLGEGGLVMGEEVGVPGASGGNRRPLPPVLWPPWTAWGEEE